MLLLLACAPPSSEAPLSLTLAAYTTPREAYGKAILPAFAARWKAEHGQDLKFEESYQGSGAQARAVVEGFEADVVALSLDPDVATVEKAGLITHDWRAGATITESIVVLAVRPGNPKGIHDWADLARDDVEVVTPNVRTSGGAMWNVAAAYGAALRGHAPAPPETFLASVLARVKVMDKGARESIVTFEKGVGDVAITYENEAIVGKLEYVVPTSTIRIENPVAVVDANVDKHGTRDVAEAFVAYLHTAEAQKAFAAYGLRTEQGGGVFPPVQDLFTIRDLGGWDEVQATVFGTGGVYERAVGAK